MPIIFLALLSWAANPPTTAWKGVYTEAQAARGQAAYTASCSGCHQPTLTGYDGLLVGEKFMEHWREDNVGNFYHLMKVSMPRGAPDTLGDKAYLDIMAFILQQNGFPDGNSELTLPQLDAIQIEGQDGPKPVPEFALVKTVGCLVREPGGEWKLEHATEPRRTREPLNSPAEDLKAAAALKGTGVVHFLHLMDYDVDRFKIPDQKGHLVEAKGLLMFKNGGPMLNLTSVATASPTCP
jgi:hypothetical protein